MAAVSCNYCFCPKFTLHDMGTYMEARCVECGSSKTAISREKMTVVSSPAVSGGYNGDA